MTTIPEPPKADESFPVSAIWQTPEWVGPNGAVVRCGRCGQALRYATLNGFETTLGEASVTGGLPKWRLTRVYGWRFDGEAWRAGRKLGDQLAAKHDRVSSGRGFASSWDLEAAREALRWPARDRGDRRRPRHHVVTAWISERPDDPHWLPTRIACPRCGRVNSVEPPADGAALNG